MYGKIHKNENGYYNKECLFISEFIDETKSAAVVFCVYLNFVGSLYYRKIRLSRLFEYFGLRLVHQIN